MKCSDFLTIRALATVLLIAGTAACAENGKEAEGAAETLICLDTGDFVTRSSDPDENRISDLNVFRFNSAGRLEERRYLEGGQITHEGGAHSFGLKLIRGLKYSVYVCANLGYEPETRTLEELLAFRYWLSRPDDFSRGIVMCGFRDGIGAAEKSGEAVRIKLRRVMSKVSIEIDNRKLDPDVNIEVTGVKVGNCPRSVPLFGTGCAKGTDDIFPLGFTKDALPAEMYLLENVDAGKYASFIEVEARYDSEEKYTEDGDRIYYRFHIGEGEGLPVERNHHYRVTLLPEGDGLGGDGESSWRIDKEDLSTRYTGEPYLIPHPAKYIECRIGDSVHLWCEVYPPNVKFSINRDNLENDTSIGLYDYVIDPDGHGITLYMKKGGTGHVYMEAGPPVDEASLFVIVCEP